MWGRQLRQIIIIDYSKLVSRTFLILFNGLWQQLPLLINIIISQLSIDMSNISGGGGLDLPKTNAANVLADKGIEIYT